MITTIADFSSLFNFTFNPYVFLSLFALLVNLGIVVAIVTRGYKNQANAYFIFLMLTISLWSFAETLSRAGTTPEVASFWNMFGAPGWIFISVLFFSFVLASVGKEEVLDSWLFKVLTLGPAFFFLALTWLTNFINYHEASYFVLEPWGWVSPSGALFSAFIIWLEFYFIAGFVLLTSYAFRTKDALRRKQMSLVVIGSLVPIVGGSLTDGFLPMFGISVPGMSVLLTTVLGAVLAFGILRYKLFVVGPTTAVPAIANTMNEALLVLNADNIIDFVNSSTLTLLGFKKDELIGETIRRLFATETEWERFEKAVLEPLKRGHVIKSYQTEFVTKKGERLPINFSASAIATARGEITGIVGLATDIRETERFITDLKAERNKLVTALSGITDGVFVLDSRGKIIFLNQVAEQLTGWPSKESLAKPFTEVAKLSSVEGEVAVGGLLPKERLTKDKVITTRQNLKLNKRDGTLAYVNLISAGIREGTEVGLGAIITLHDVTREKELEEMKLDFVAIAAHELRTPITAIRGYLSILMEETAKKLKPQERSWLEKSFFSTTSLSALVENLLLISRIELRTLKLDLALTDWTKLLEGVVAPFEPQAKQREISLKVKLPAKLPDITADKFRVGEVVSNLLSNALTHTQKGGKVEVGAYLKDGEVVTYVRDSGVGIPKEALPHLFNKFFRVSGVLEEGSKGTGLGLYISKSIIDMHEGKIWVESELGKGSTFCFALPVESKLKSAGTKLATFAKKKS